jgi:cell division protein FtsI/penicillin-binding protein 2
VALAPFPSPKYVVAVTDEAGGFGADTAAPMARTILAKLFGVRGDKARKGGPSD